MVRRTTWPVPLAAAMALTIEAVVLPSVMQSRPYWSDGNCWAILDETSASLSAEVAEHARVSPQENRTVAGKSRRDRPSAALARRIGAPGGVGGTYSRTSPPLRTS